MTDRPMLFSAPMIRALLAGTKTQTRRVLRKPRWAMPDHDFEIEDDGPHIVAANTGCMARLLTPVAGDRFWVKEGYADEHPLSVQPGRYSQLGRAGIPGPPPVTYQTIYRVDGEPLQVWRNGSGTHPYFSLDGPADDIAAQHAEVCSNYARGGRGIYWDNPRYMPRWASRLILAVSAVKFERLQEITEGDAIAEGIERIRIPGAGEVWAKYPRTQEAAVGWLDPRQSYESLWESINGKGSWDANPWVVAYTFKVERAQIDQVGRA